MGDLDRVHPCETMETASSMEVTPEVKMQKMEEGEPPQDSETSDDIQFNEKLFEWKWGSGAGGFQIWKCKGIGVWSAQSVGLFAFAISCINAIFSLCCVNSAFSAFCTNCCFSILSYNSVFSVLSGSSFFAIGCKGESFKICY